MADLSDVMKAFSSPPRESLLKGDDADREAAFRTRINSETGSPRGLRDPSPSSMPRTVSIAQLKSGK